MSSEGIRPATWLDVVAIVPRAPVGVVVGLRSQLEAGPAYALTRGGRVVMIAGLVPLPGGGAGGWFVPGPGAASAMRAMVRHARLTLAAAPYRPVIVQVKSEAGRRIARAIGFSPGWGGGPDEVMTYG
jgi:hypothetical protein